MSSFLSLPLAFLKFWFFEAPGEILAYFMSLNTVFLEQFSLPLLFKTFLKPIKNEYREGLIWFSIGLGMFVKFWIILVDILILIVLLIIEFMIVLAFLAWPFGTLALLFL